MYNVTRQAADSLTWSHRCFNQAGKEGRHEEQGSSVTKEASETLFLLPPELVATVATNELESILFVASSLYP